MKDGRSFPDTSHPSQVFHVLQRRISLRTYLHETEFISKGIYQRLESLWVPLLVFHGKNRIHSTALNSYPFFCPDFVRFFIFCERKIWPYINRPRDSCACAQ